MKGVTNDTTILILPHYGREMERIMGAILGSTTDQAVMAFLLLEIAKRHGIDVEFDFSNPYNPKVNFIGGTYEQHEALAMELAEKFQEV